MMKVLSLFDGISCGQLALREAGIKYEKYFASEIDKFAISVAMEHFPDTVQIGDVRYVDQERLPEIDLMIGGSPCQDLSRASVKGKGLSGEKSLLFHEFVRLKKEVKPKFFLFENVLPRKKSWKFEMDELLGISGFQINSDRFVPQNRCRFYWTNIQVGLLPARPPWNMTFYYCFEKKFHKMKTGTAPCLRCAHGKRNMPLLKPDINSFITLEECEKLQGIPEGYTSKLSHSRRNDMIGNAWTIPVIAHIFRGMNGNQQNL